MKKLFILGFVSAVMLAAAQESSSASGQPKNEPAPAALQEILKRTTHGRNMLAREGTDPEEGRFLRALSACIRYYTEGTR